MAPKQGVQHIGVLSHLALNTPFSFTILELYLDVQCIISPESSDFFIH